MADEKKLPFNTAVEVSYLRTEEQQILLQYMSNHNMVPSMKQAKELKQISKERMLTYSEIDQICMNENTEKVQVQIPAKKLKQYFPETYTKTQMEEIIFIAGLPFGIHKMRLILIPRGMDTTATLGMAALSVIIGALIGSIMIPVYVIRAIYVFIRYIIER